MAKKIGNKQKTITARVLELLVGVVFAISCIGKVSSVDRFAELIVRYGFPQLSCLAPIIVIIEALCAICLLLELYPRAVSAVTGAMLLCFTGAFFYASTYEGVTDCGCFGKLVENTPAWLTYLRNALLFASSVGIVILLPWGYSKCTTAKWIIAAVVMSAVIYETGQTYKTAPRYKEAHPLYNQPVGKTVIGKYLTTHRDSTYVLYVYSYDCTTCLDGLNNAKEYGNRDIADRLIGLSVSEDKDSAVHRAFNITFDEIAVGLGLQNVVTGIPVLLYVKNDTIKYVIEGAVPAAYNFKRYYLDME
ncbi:MAG: hypothetical protein K6A67_00420 [Bacteroidales bacterium]|nr:hypothetical protein [Bacteroidales bacterium]